MIKKNQRKRPEVNHKQIVLSILVIALSAVIAVNANPSVSLDQNQQSAPTAPIATDNKIQENQHKTSADLEAKSSSSAVLAAEQPMKKQLESEKIESNKESEVTAESKLSPRVDLASKVQSAEDVASKADVGDNKQAMSSTSSKETDLVAKTSDSESNKRKARADTATSAAAAPSDSKQEASASKPAAEAKKTESKLEPKASPVAAAAAVTKPTKQLAKSASKSKLPANLGTVTSTGSSGGHSYMSKHDAYSAIAEKHGALAQDAMKKSDKRQLQTGFGGIQKASGIGDMLSPFKGVTDSGLARTLGASMRSIMKSKYSVPAYVASALLGAVALMAFYESPISPLPVPALPEPPVGRFPPEMPNLPVGTQVPFRGGNQQGGGGGGQYYGQNYNQRSLNQQMPISNSQNYLAQQAQQVLFPGNNVAQQRQMNVANGGPVQQLASNLLSSVGGGKQQIAQRKSSPDYDLSSRSFFGSTLPNASPKQGMTSSSMNGQPKQGNSFLSYFGFGGQSNNVPTESNNMQSAQGAMQMSGISNLNLQNQANMPLASASSVEPKGAANQAGALSNSHLVNKVKSLFSRSPSHSSAIGSSHSSALSSASGNPYEPYQRMSLVQALMKDTAFIPGFLTPTRKSSTNSGSSQSGGAANKLQSTLTNALSGSPNPSSRMQVESGSNSLHLPASLKQNNNNNKPSSGSDNGGYGLYRVAHALLETFTSGVGHARQANSHGSSSNNQLSESIARKSSSNDDSSSSPSLAAATSLMSEIVSSYDASNREQKSQQQAASQSQPQSSPPSSSSSSQSSASPSSPSSQSNSNQQQSANNQQQSNDQISARSGEIVVSNNDQEPDQQNAKSQSATNNMAQVSSNNSNQNKPQSQASPSSASSQDAHVRKTRSIGFEYPIESNQELARREQQPSKASQINNVIDFVADSYSQNRILFNFVMNQVGLSQAVPYVEQILAPGANEHH